MAQVTELLSCRVTQGHLQTLEWGPRRGASLSLSGEALQAKHVKFLEKERETEKENEVAFCQPMVCCFGYFYVYISQLTVASCRAELGSQPLYLYSSGILGRPPPFPEPQCPPLLTGDKVRAHRGAVSLKREKTHRPRSGVRTQSALLKGWLASFPVTL